MITLAIETSSHQGSVALLSGGGRLLFDASCGAGRSHSSQLFGVLEEALRAVPEGERLGQIAVGLGPGSYAGVRIAISAATGLAIATDAPLVGVPSIVALEEGEYAALGDARRETFSFARVRDGECVEGPLLLNAAELAEKVAACGVPVFASEEIAAPLPVPVQLRYPSAQRLARLAAEGRAIAARGNLEPLYLREPHITQPKKA
ncbi:MAG: tRNA (adenosine(37)-N6)-threonylcarbamoyltransferase complex dimerization subunit type 1 TsaB [Chthoniobacteraceae bacterium]|nr:tRNA (adenosine(37)-N6)-threonylcarbamoyltransferase complex dimerization subunit type 1 TsaB [Chthoniobacteraceae bacterium]